MAEENKQTTKRNVVVEEFGMEDEFKIAKYRADLLLGLIFNLMGSHDTPHRKPVMNVIEPIFTIIAKYQDPGAEFMDQLTPDEIAKDMLHLTTYNMNISIASARSITAGKHYHAKGRKLSAEAFLQEKARCEQKGEKYTVKQLEMVGEKKKGDYHLRETREEAEGQALAMVADVCDKTVQVLKKIFERMNQEAAHSRAM